MTAQVRPVVVGVNGSKDNLGALRYAAEEARRAGLPLRLVHVVPDYVPIAPMIPLAPEDLTAMGAALLARAEATVREVAPDLEVEGWICHGSRAIELTRIAADGKLLVIGRDDRPLVERVLTGDVGAGVAARSSVPMVEVTSDWQPGEARGVVLVGVKSPDHADSLLGDAMALASARGAALLVLHAWKLPGGYDDIIESRVATDEWRQQSVAEMDTLLEQWRAAYPDVEVELRVVHDHAAHALVQASAEADVLVVVRRGHGVPAAVHLGSTARAVLRAARCPVRVVPPEALPVMPTLVLEDAGAIVR